MMQDFNHQQVRYTRKTYFGFWRPACSYLEPLGYTKGHKSSDPESIHQFLGGSKYNIMAALGSWVGSQCYMALGANTNILVWGRCGNHKLGANIARGPGLLERVLMNLASASVLP